MTLKPPLKLRKELQLADRDCTQTTNNLLQFGQNCTLNCIKHFFSMLFPNKVGDRRRELRFKIFLPNIRKLLIHKTNVLYNVVLDLLNKARK